MKRFSHFAVGVQQGSEVLFSAFADGSEMWTGDGPREHRHAVRFRGGFERMRPWCISACRCGTSTSKAISAWICFADEVESGGFTIVFRTWGDTRVARVRADWLAISPPMRKTGRSRRPPIPL